MYRWRFNSQLLDHLRFWTPTEFGQYPILVYHRFWTTSAFGPPLLFDHPAFRPPQLLDHLSFWTTSVFGTPQLLDHLSFWNTTAFIYKSCRANSLKFRLPWSKELKKTVCFGSFWFGLVWFCIGYTPKFTFLGLIFLLVLYVDEFSQK